MGKGGEGDNIIQLIKLINGDNRIDDDNDLWSALSVLIVIDIYFLQSLLRVFTGLGFIVGPVIGGGLYQVSFSRLKE